MIRAEILRRFDWPPKEFGHGSGDTQLGELCRHQGLRPGEFTDGVRINADARGVHSAAPRRGLDEAEHGADYQPGMVYPTSYWGVRTQSARIAPTNHAGG